MIKHVVAGKSLDKMELDQSKDDGTLLVAIYNFNQKNPLPPTDRDLKLLVEKQLIGQFEDALLSCIERKEVDLTIDRHVSLTSHGKARALIVERF